MLAIKHIRIAKKNKKQIQIKKKESGGIFGKLFSGIMMDENENKNENEKKENTNENENELFNKFEELISLNNTLLHKDTFCEILKLLLFEIQKYSNLNSIYSGLLCDYLLLIDNMENIQSIYNGKYHLNYSSCLIDLIIRHTKIIKIDGLKWNDIAKLQLVRRLLILCKYDCSHNVIRLINGAIFMYNKRENGWDHSFNTLIVRSFEEKYSKQFSDGKPLCSKWINNKQEPIKLLQCIAQIKIQLSYYISYLSQIIADVVNIDIIFEKYKLNNIFNHKINYLLSIIPNAKWLYSLHIWFLKQMYSLRGMEWTEVLICNKLVRQSCPIFIKSNVFNQLKRASANIPSLDTFALIGDRYYTYASSIHLLINKKQQIDIEFKRNQNDRTAIIASIFNEIYLIQHNNQYNLSSSPLNFNLFQNKYNKHLFLNSNDSKFEIQFINNLLSNNKNIFNYNNKTSIEDVMIMRLLIHMFICITPSPYSQSKSNNNPLYLLYKQPELFLDGYLISMPPDMLALVHNAIENKKTRIWLCPKGHPYLIGECGRPTVESKCHCGEIIGGKSHNPVENVKPMDNYKAKSPKGYVLTGSNDENKNINETFRQCKPYVVKCMRLFMHLIMLLHVYSNPTNDCQGLCKLIHQKDCTKCQLFLWSQIRANLNSLSQIQSSNYENICIGIHLLLNDMICTNILYGNIENIENISQEIDRDTFEQLLNAFIEKQLIYHSKNSTIEKFRTENKNAAHLRLLMIEILEQKNLASSLNTLYRFEYIPHLFLRCENVTLNSFFTYVSSNNENEKLYPNLWKIIHARPLFWCLKYIPYLSKWLSLIYKRYLRKKTLDECREMKISDILNDVKINKWGDSKQWNNLWNKFRECWNYISSQTRKNKNDEIEYECKTLIIPQLSLDNNNVSMIYSLPSDIGDGILILEIIKNLQNIQNEFLYSYYEEQENENIITNRQTLFNIRSDHCITLSHSNLLNIILQNSIPEINYGSSSAIKFDLNSIETSIITQYIFGRYPMEIDIRSFQFMGQQNIASLILLISNNIKQETLSFDIWQTFNKQFETSFQRRKALHIFEEFISFLSKTNNLNEIYIYKFMKNILQMNKSEYNSFKLNHNDHQLQLKHIKSLWTYLTQTLQRDDAKRSKAPKHTLHKYKIQITNQLKNKLNIFTKNIPLGLLGQIVLKWKNQLQSYGNVEYNIVNSNVNQFLFGDDDIILPKNVQFPQISLQYFGTAFEYIAEKFYKLSN